MSKCSPYISSCSSSIRSGSPAAIGWPGATTQSRSRSSATAPLQVAAGAHQALEDLGEVRRVQRDQPHARRARAPGRARRPRRATSACAWWPHQSSTSVWPSTVAARPCSGSSSVAVRTSWPGLAQRRGERLVDAVRIDRADRGVAALVAELVPDRDPERRGHGLASASTSAIRTGRPPSRAERIAANIRARLFRLSSALLAPSGGRAVRDPAGEGRERALAVLAAASPAAAPARAAAGPIEGQAVELLALLEGAAEGELDRAARCRRCASGRHRAWSARARSSCRGSSTSVPLAKRIVATAAGRPLNGEPGSLQLWQLDLDRLVVEHEAQAVEVVDRHVAEQRLVEEEVAVAGAEQEMEVEVAGHRPADRALAQQLRARAAAPGTSDSSG